MEIKINAPTSFVVARLSNASYAGTSLVVYAGKLYHRIGGYTSQLNIGIINNLKRK